MALHKDLTGIDLHEPKGIATATSGQVLRADGLGSGSWQTLTIPSGTFKVTRHHFTSAGTWTKPANCFGIHVHMIGGGGGGNGNPGSGLQPGGNGGNSSFASIPAFGGSGASASAPGAGGIAITTGGAVLESIAGGAGETRDMASGVGGLGDTYGPFSYISTGRTHGLGGVNPSDGNHGGGSGAYTELWLEAADLSSTMPVFVGAGGTGAVPLAVGYAGAVYIYEYISI